MPGSDIILETSRCYLRKMKASDAPGLYQLNLPEEILIFTTDPPFENEEAARKFVLSYDAYDRTGMGRWAVIFKETEEFAGWCGLKYHSDENEVDIGYRLLPEHRNKGIATETALAVLKYGHETLGLRRIVARVHPQNDASVRVLDKLAMHYEKVLFYDNAPWLNYVSEIQSTNNIKPKCWPFPAIY